MNSTRLFVGNLPDNINKNDLRTAFSVFGEVIAIDIKTKPALENDKKLFAFVTLSASNFNIESCIKHFANGDSSGNQLYVTRARESFLERLQRERKENQKEEKQNNALSNVCKRKYDKNNIHENGDEQKSEKTYKGPHELKLDDIHHNKTKAEDGFKHFKRFSDPNKVDSDKKRLESMKKKRQEFNEKKLIIRTGLIGIDKAPNKKLIFSDNDEEMLSKNLFLKNNSDYNELQTKQKTELFEEGDDSDNEVNFEIKKQYEGKTGQKVLELQSRYKADKRFVLDERFIEGDKSDEEPNEGEVKDEDIELGQTDEKYKQLNILQDVLGVPIKVKQTQDAKQTKTKFGMLRYDPTHPEHAKYLAPIKSKQELKNHLKQKKSKETSEETDQESKKIEKVEVSKEQFYKVSDTLKEAIAQSNSFSLRSLFGKEDNVDADDKVTTDVNHDYKIVKSKNEKKITNSLDTGEKNPFVYDSSDSENEDETRVQTEGEKFSEPKSVWREKLFFTESDDRLKEGLLFFTQMDYEKVNKDRRQLKSVMKKRAYNKERKNQMFQKKIGGRRKSVKKNFRKK